MTISECAVALFIVMKRRDGQNKFGPVALSGEVVQHRPAGVEFCPGKKKKKAAKGTIRARLTLLAQQVGEITGWKAASSASVNPGDLEVNYLGVFLIHGQRECFSQSE